MEKRQKPACRASAALGLLMAIVLALGIAPTPAFALGGGSPTLATGAMGAQEAQSWHADMGVATEHGSLDSVDILLPDGSPCEGATAAYDAASRTVNVELDHRYGVNASLRASFSLTQEDGLPWLSNSRYANTAVDCRDTSFAVDLAAGSALVPIYLYDIELLTFLV